jgi:peptidoglycan hydrolase CwlO-like protein
LIREKYNILHIGVINNVVTFNKALVSQQKDKTKHTKKKHPHNNKHHKPSQPSSTPNGEK